MTSLFVMIAVAVVIVAAVLLLTILFKKSSRSRSGRIERRSGYRRDDTSTRWRAVKIVPGLICCDAVNKYSEQIFLARLSPSLPLENCTEKDCRCKYIHLQDRRSGGDRRVELGELDNFLPISQSDRRRLADRRAADLNA